MHFHSNSVHHLILAFCNSKISKFLHLSFSMCYFITMLLLFLKTMLALFFDCANFSFYIIGRRSFINNTKSWTLAKGNDYFLTDFANRARI
uniref:Putative ovule protein n=1 Tax=Solanum chacoense TaxID=4108 RepID=A0A0V0HJH5_SOLCH